MNREGKSLPGHRMLLSFLLLLFLLQIFKRHKEIREMKREDTRSINWPVLNRDFSCKILPKPDFSSPNFWIWQNNTGLATAFLCLLITCISWLRLVRTLYPPLSTSFMSLSPSSTAVMVFGLLMSGISSSLTSVNFWRTIINLRSYYLSLKTIPLFPWSLFVTGGMLLLTLPILSGALLMVLADLHSNTLFFDPIFGGDPIFYQHLFWFFGHPEVYILIIPAFGIISIIISGILQKIIFGNPSMIFAMSCISLLGSVLLGHHMYTVGLETDSRAYFTGVTILISLPTGTKIFNWLSTYLGNPPLLQLFVYSFSIIS